MTTSSRSRLGAWSLQRPCATRGALVQSARPVALALRVPFVPLRGQILSSKPEALRWA
ncbi:MAG: hypothetical protein AVDCRST_MAG64-3780 [uncultured Phycisphaerae bacterium]|uniref:Uncharacterized protein n=1 Tax=uncultured Phycisphaerae bacterium TaxID=904963 RepID=A0A6J4QEC8_9BACT|nr:MAG: hypothetical protein AVDCRST_MAG64-3780 [uncultured Phycisphaerae bacterium]